MSKANTIRICLWMIMSGMSSIAFGQGLVVTGHVSDENDQPLPAVTVVVKGTTNGVVTNVDGNYSITINTPDPVLTFSLIGYVSEDIPAGDKQVVDIQLVPDFVELDEIVVVGYGTQRKSDITTSMVNIKSDDLRTETQGNFTATLQGKASGVQVITNNGAPGAVPKVLIRGFTTINSGTDPLYVVDGVPIVNTSGNSNVNFINSDEIESVEVLKDASAAAIYGTRASAGVILINTKRGKAGKTRYDINLSYGSQSSQKPYENLKSLEYARAMNLSYKNNGFWNLVKDTTNLNYTDWWDAGIRDRSPQINVSFNASGGTEKHKFNIMASYYEQESFYNVGKWQRFTARVNNDLKLAEWISVGIDLNPRREFWENTPDWYGDYLLIDPITTIMTPEDELIGNENEYSKYMRSIYTFVWNPVAREGRQEGNNGDNYALYSNAYIDLKPIKNLVIRSQAGANIISTTYNSFNPQFTIDASHEFNSITRISRRKISDFNWTWQNTATYNLSVSKHRVSLMAGMTAEEQNSDFIYAYAEGFPNTSQVMRQLDASNGTVTDVGGNSYRNSIVSYIGRLTYNYDDRYLFTATGRRDGSSKFLENNKWAFFPSASAAWRFSNEKFLKDNAVLSDGKLFAGWGTVGNQGIPSDVYLSKLTTDYYVFGDDATVTSITSPSTLKNEDIKWETIEERNIGIDVRLFKSSLSATLEYYQKITHDMLFQMNYPYFSGFPNWGNVWTNIGRMQAKGIDVALGYNYRNEKLSFEVGATFSTARMEMLELAGTEELLSGPVWNSINTTRMVVGEEPGYFYGYKTDGIFQNDLEVSSYTDENGKKLQPFARPGDIRFVDIDTSGVIDSEDRTKIGSPYPDFTGGISLNAVYNTKIGAFDMGANFYFCYGNEVVNWLKNSKYNAVGQTNLADDALDQAWHGEGTSDDIPILMHNDLNQNYTKFSDFYVEDGSYLRLKSIQIGYSLPAPICTRLKLTKVRLYVSGQNLFTWTKFTGVDPESSFSPLNYGFQGFSYPMQKTYLAGFNISF